MSFKKLISKLGSMKQAMKKSMESLKEIAKTFAGKIEDVRVSTGT